jgi:hypothetical protein
VYQRSERSERRDQRVEAKRWEGVEFSCVGCEGEREGGEVSKDVSREMGEGVTARTRGMVESMREEEKTHLLATDNDRLPLPLLTIHPSIHLLKHLPRPSQLRHNAMIRLQLPRSVLIDSCSRVRRDEREAEVEEADTAVELGGERGGLAAGTEEGEVEGEGFLRGESTTVRGTFSPPPSILLPL